MLDALRAEVGKRAGGQGKELEQGGRRLDEWGAERRVVLEEKYFRRMDKFEGDMAKFRGWVFDLGVAIGGVDEKLSKTLERLGRYEDKDKWEPEQEGQAFQEIHEKYKGELYGLLCSITQGEAKVLVRGVYDTGKGNDGFRAFMLLNHRYDQRNNAILLQAFLEVVGSPSLKGIRKIVSEYIHGRQRCRHFAAGMERKRES